MDLVDFFQMAKVAMVKGPPGLVYPGSPPFLPAEGFPELLGRVQVGSGSNGIYPLLRELFCDFGLDVQNFGTPAWNPLGAIIAPGERVLIKPNLVRHLHLAGGDFQAVVTHASVVRCTLDYVAKALSGKGEILVGDAPVQSANFPTLIEKTGLAKVCNDVATRWGISVRLVDFRLVAVELDERHCITRTEEKQGDPAGYLNVDLGRDSMLMPLNDYCDKFRVTSYDCKEMIKHHNHERHEYLIPKSVLKADVVINLPKLKTHRKVGLTAALKNLVGINGHKDWLPHHRCGSYAEGGDEYLHPSFIKRTQNFLGETQFKRSGSAPFGPILYYGIRALNRLAHTVCRDSFTEGSWYGNDTVWRMVLDLNRLLIYADSEGRMTATPQRKVFTIVDAIISGDGEGPMEPNARHCGMLVCGFNPLAVDTVLATLVGFDYRHIPLLANGYTLEKWKIADFNPADISVMARDALFKDFAVGKAFDRFCFRPPEGWLGRIEFPACQGGLHG
jgi:uncharacterized protein (DUF362 family)